MPRLSRFNTALEELVPELPRGRARVFTREVHEQIADNGDIHALVMAPIRKERLVTFSFDRRLNHHAFNYSKLDSVLVLVDKLCGSGIKKPVNQVRVLRWNASRDALVTVMRFLVRRHPDIDFYRCLVLPYPSPVAGFRVLRGVYRK